MIRTIDSFAVQYWFYGQLYLLGHTGKIDANLTPFKGAKLIDKLQKKLLSSRK